MYTVVFAGNQRARYHLGDIVISGVIC